MKTQEGIISKMEIPAGYNIRIGKTLWYSLCFTLNILVMLVSQIPHHYPEGLSIGVLFVSLVVSSWPAIIFTHSGTGFAGW